MQLRYVSDSNGVFKTRPSELLKQITHMKKVFIADINGYWQEIIIQNGK